MRASRPTRPSRHSQGSAPASAPGLSRTATATDSPPTTVFAGQKVGIKQVSEQIWLVSFMGYDLGYFDHETCRLEPLENPFGPKVLPMSPV